MALQMAHARACLVQVTVSLRVGRKLAQKVLPGETHAGQEPSVSPPPLQVRQFPVNYCQLS